MHDVFDIKNLKKAFIAVVSLVLALTLATPSSALAISSNWTLGAQLYDSSYEALDENTQTVDTTPDDRGGASASVGPSHLYANMYDSSTNAYLTDPIKCTITWDEGYTGGKVYSEIYDYGQTIEKADPVRAATSHCVYAFAGWSSNGPNTTPTGIYPVADSMRYTAQWIEVPITGHFGGPADEGSEATTGSTLRAQLFDSSLPGGGTISGNGNTAGPGGNTTLSARFFSSFASGIPINPADWCNVWWVDNDGNAVHHNSVPTGSKISSVEIDKATSVIPKSIVIDGKTRTFLGWDPNPYDITVTNYNTVIRARYYTGDKTSVMLTGVSDAHSHVVETPKYFEPGRTGTMQFKIDEGYAVKSVFKLEEGSTTEIRMSVFANPSNTGTYTVTVPFLEKDTRIRIETAEYASITLAASDNATYTYKNHTGTAEATFTEFIDPSPSSNIVTFKAKDALTKHMSACSVIKKTTSDMTGTTTSYAAGEMPEYSFFADKDTKYVRVEFKEYFTLTSTIDSHTDIETSNGDQKVYAGDKTDKITYKAHDDYEIVEVTINGVDQTLSPNAEEYTYPAISLTEDVAIKVKTEYSPRVPPIDPDIDEETLFDIEFAKTLNSKDEEDDSISYDAPTMPGKTRVYKDLKKDDLISLPTMSELFIDESKSNVNIEGHALSGWAVSFEEETDGHKSVKNTEDETYEFSILGSNPKHKIEDIYRAAHRDYLDEASYERDDRGKKVLRIKIKLYATWIVIAKATVPTDERVLLMFYPDGTDLGDGNTTDTTLGVGAPLQVISDTPRSTNLYATSTVSDTPLDITKNKHFKEFCDNFQIDMTLLGKHMTFLLSHEDISDDMRIGAANNTTFYWTDSISEVMKDKATEDPSNERLTSIPSFPYVQDDADEMIGTQREDTFEHLGTLFAGTGNSTRATIEKRRVLLKLDVDDTWTANERLTVKKATEYTDNLLGQVNTTGPITSICWKIELDRSAQGTHYMFATKDDTCWPLPGTDPGFVPRP